MAKSKTKKEAKQKAPAKKAANKKTVHAEEPAKEAPEAPIEKTEEELAEERKALEKELSDIEHEIIKCVAFTYKQKEIPELEEKKEALLKKLGRG